MARDGLGALARLRRLEVAEARRRMALMLAQEAAAAERLAGAGAALRAEAAADATSWRLWLPRGLAERDRAALARDQAAVRRDQAQDALAEARAAERAVELLREQQAAAARRRAARREQALLDDVAQRRRPSDPPAP